MKKIPYQKREFYPIRVNSTISEELSADLKKLVEIYNTSLSEIMRCALECYVEFLYENLKNNEKNGHENDFQNQKNKN
jgi:hypothetical protein